MRNKLEQKLFSRFDPELERLGYDLIDIKYLKEDGSYYLRFFIDKRGGIQIEDCERVSNFIDPILDEMDEKNELQIAQHYSLDVSSCGLDFELKTEKDFLRYLGAELECSLYQTFLQHKKWIGKLLHYDASSKLLDIEVSWDLYEKEAKNKKEKLLLQEEKEALLSIFSKENLLRLRLEQCAKIKRYVRW